MPQLIGNSLPGDYRPFLADSPWNTEIPSNATKHPDSDTILAYMRPQSSKLLMSREYCIPVWDVNYFEMPKVRPRSDKIFDWWDQNRNGISDVDVPWIPEMYAEQTSDGHICIVDRNIGMAWEMSRFKPPASPGEAPTCTTLNLWNLKLSGVGDNPNVVETERWWARGGRGSGAPEIAGLMRPEELEHGEIRHKLVFTFPECRKADDGSKIFIHPPACRSDGEHIGKKYPIQGMLFQLVDYDESILSEDARIVARALHKYGMILCDKGGAWKIQPQLLHKNKDEHRAIWNRRCANIYSEIEKIPTSQFRIVQTFEPTTKRG